MECFTDEDLKKLKERYVYKAGGSPMVLSGDEIDAIVNRIEKSDLCIDGLIAGHDAHWRDSSIYRDYLQASGKTGRDGE